jgi:putative transcriptional regulator
MTLVHHLDDATVVRFASGDLDEAFAVVVASHLAMCATCRHSVRAAEEIGGHLLESDAAADLSDEVFDRTMARIDEAGDEGARAPTARHHSDVGDATIPAPLLRFVGSKLDAIKWRSVAPGVKKHPIELNSATNSSLYMLHIAPGKAVPEHGHGGAEVTLILTGAYRDALGRFGPGDIADLDEHVEHQPIVEPGAACICLVATEAPTRFKGVFSRLLQPLVGI